MEEKLGDTLIGSAMLVLGIVYFVYRVGKSKRDNDKGIWERVSNIDSWGIIAILILGGIVIIFR
ncbi:hypothetical protein LPB136_09465 [Tenacibaculum todarodis]|uniref:Uncharacterized protein n=1 Tax=Tenacibaculum todarodis TaxID=1850252 RepID=A0A1L3JKG3_9FLAO|nr:hypothetical protein [Tenacibaculum todarodis]APG65574.1 hypothetical protein LPB136_09465 [Tenacibaculum todarodis]